jgi:hypothetical protein
MTRRSKLKGYRVVKKGAKTVVEEIPGYGMSVSARIASRKKIKVSRRAPT